jgi:hypothetical protein
MSSNSTAVQRPEVLAFIERIHHVHPGGALDDALQPSLDFEAKIRQLWATDKTNIILQDPYVGLLEVFATPDALRVTNARKAKEAKTHATDDQDEGDENEMNDLQDEYIMPLKAKDRRKTGEPCIVKDMKEFIAQFQIFTGNSSSMLTCIMLTTAILFGHQKAVFPSLTGPTLLSPVAVFWLACFQFPTKPRSPSEPSASGSIQPSIRLRISISSYGVSRLNRSVVPP